MMPSPKTHHRWNALKFLTSRPRGTETAVKKHDVDYTRTSIVHRNSLAIPKAVSQPIPISQGLYKLFWQSVIAQKKQLTPKVVVRKRLRILCVCHLIMRPIIVITLTWYQDVLHSFLSPPMKAPSPPPTAISLAEEWFPAPAKSVMQPSGTRLVCQFFGLPLTQWASAQDSSSCVTQMGHELIQETPGFS